MKKEICNAYTELNDPVRQRPALWRTGWVGRGNHKKTTCLHLVCVWPATPADEDKWGWKPQTLTGGGHISRWRTWPVWALEFLYKWGSGRSAGMICGGSVTHFLARMLRFPSWCIYRGGPRDGNTAPTGFCLLQFPCTDGWFRKWERHCWELSVSWKSTSLDSQSPRQWRYFHLAESSHMF